MDSFQEYTLLIENKIVGDSHPLQYDKNIVVPRAIHKKLLRHVNLKTSNDKESHPTLNHLDNWPFVFLTFTASS